MAKWHHPLLPPNPTKEERYLVAGSIVSVYAPFSDPVDKLIIALAFEMGYPQYLVADVLNLSEGAVSLRIKKIKTVLSLKYSIDMG